MTRVGARLSWLIGGAVLLPACASLPPERVALRATLDKAASECRVTFPIIVRYEIDPFDQLIYYYRENVRYEDRQQFLDCVSDRVRDAGVTLAGAGVGPSVPTLVYPDDLRIVTPSAALAPERAAYSGHWVGALNEQRAAPHALVVEQVEDAESAIVVFAAIGSNGPGWSRFRARFVDDGLQFTAEDGLVATYRVQSDGTLLATIEHQNRLFRSRMTRRP
jgi:hypothetical protein